VEPRPRSPRKRTCLLREEIQADRKARRRDNVGLLVHERFDRIWLLAMPPLIPSKEGNHDRGPGRCAAESTRGNAYFDMIVEEARPSGGAYSDYMGNGGNQVHLVASARDDPARNRLGGPKEENGPSTSAPYQALHLWRIPQAFLQRFVSKNRSSLSKNAIYKNDQGCRQAAWAERIAA